MSRKITVWGINYAPELTGIGPYNTSLCRYLTERGHEVRMVTSFPYYPAWRKETGDRSRLFRTDSIDGTAVHRCWHYVPQRPSTFRRIVHEATFVASSFLRLLSLPRPDLLVVVSPPLLLGFAARWMGKLKGCPYIFHVQDLQPDAAADLGMVRQGWLLSLLRYFERIAYHHAARVSGISKGMLDAFHEKGVPETKLVYLPNPILPHLHAALPARGGFRQRYGFADDDFLAIYSGNLGRKQGLEILLEAARHARNPKVRIVICGDGSHRPALEAMMQQERLPSVSLLPLQSTVEYGELMADMDLCLITQLSGSGRCFLPSKLLAALAAGKPVLAVADPDSDLVTTLREGAFGVNVPPGDPGRLAEELDSLAAQPDVLQQSGLAAQRFAKKFDLNTIFGRLEAVIDEIVASSQHKLASLPLPSRSSSPADSDRRDAA